MWKIWGDADDPLWEGRDEEEAKRQFRAHDDGRTTYAQAPDGTEYIGLTAGGAWK